MRGLYSCRPEARLQPAFAPFSPANLLPAFGLPGCRLRGGRPLIAVVDCSRWPPLALRWGGGEFWRLQPHSHLRQDTHGIVQPPLFQLLSELGPVTIAGVSQHYSIRQTPASYLINDFQRQFPLLTKDEVLRNPRLAPSLAIVDPTLRQVQPPSQRYIPLFPNMMNADCDLAVAGLSQRARVLSHHAHRVRTLFWKTSIIENPCRIRLQFGRHSSSQSLPHRGPLPRALSDELLHGLHVPLRQSCRQGLYRFPLTIQEQASYVHAAPMALLSPAYRFQQVGNKLHQPLAATRCLGISHAQTYQGIYVLSILNVVILVSYPLFLGFAGTRCRRGFKERQVN